MQLRTRCLMQLAEQKPDHFLLLHINTATLQEAKLHRRSHESSGGNAPISGEANIRGTVHIDMVPPRDPRPDLPLDPPVDLNVDHYGAGGALVLLQRGQHKRRDGDDIAEEKRRPDGEVAVALVGVGERGGEGDLLAPVGGVDAERVVVDADARVGVVGGEGDLHGEGEGVGCGGGEVEGVEGGVLEGEVGLCGAEDDPDEEDDEEDEDDEGRDGAEDEAEEVAALG